MTAARLDRRTVLRGLGVAGVGATAGWAVGADAAEAVTKPNIVILIDDRIFTEPVPDPGKFLRSR